MAQEINLKELANKAAEELVEQMATNFEDEQTRASAIALIEVGFTKGFVDGETYLSDQVKAKLGLSTEEDEEDIEG